MEYREFVNNLTSQEVTFHGKEDLVHACMGIGGEAGEIIDKVKKSVFMGRELDIEDLKLELGDLLFYIQLAANDLGCTIEDLIKLNMKKLSVRYPTGEFRVEDSENRDTQAEIKATAI